MSQFAGIVGFVMIVAMTFGYVIRIVAAFYAFRMGEQDAWRKRGVDGIAILVASAGILTTGSYCFSWYIDHSPTLSAARYVLYAIFLSSTVAYALYCAYRSWQDKGKP